MNEAEIIINLLATFRRCSGAGCSRVATHSGFQVCTDHLEKGSEPSYPLNDLWAIWEAEMTIGRFGISATRRQWESVGLHPRTPPGGVPIVGGTVVYLPNDRQLAIVTTVMSPDDGEFGSRIRLVTDDGQIYDASGIPMVAIATIDIKTKTK